VFGGTTLNYIVNPIGNGWFIIVGVALALVANLFASLAHWEQSKVLSTPSNEQTIPSVTSHLTVNKDHTDDWDTDAVHAKKLGTLKGTLACIMAGIFFSIWPTFMQYAMEPTNPSMPPLSNYVAFFVITVFGVVSVVFVSSMFFLFPYRGVWAALSSWASYYRLSPPINLAADLLPTNDSVYTGWFWGWHLLALLGGIIWCVGTLANILASSTIGFAISYFLGQASVIIAVLIGLVIWREFDGSSMLAKIYLGGFFLAYIGAVVAISLSTSE
jgi:drug/metabolite transporter (DMT)-like permease